MIKCTCLSKIRDNNGKIVTYCLQDGQGNIQNMDSDILKNGIYSIMCKKHAVSQ